MSSPSSVNKSPGGANSSGNDAEGPPQDAKKSDLETIEDLKKKLQKLEEKNLELSNKHHQNISRYEKEIMKLKLELERGESLRQVLEREMYFATRAAQVQMDSAEEELCDAKAKLLKLQARWGDPRSYTLSAIQIPSGGILYVTSPTSGTDTTSASWGDQSYNRHFGLRGADHPTPGGMRYASDTDLQRYWRPCSPLAPAVLFPNCRRGRNYDVSSGSYMIVTPSNTELDSSYIFPSSSFSSSNPSSWSAQATGSGSSINPFISFRQCRAQSLPPLRYCSQDISSRTGRNQSWQ